LIDSPVIFALARMVSLGLNPETQSFIVVMDAYSVHISEKFLTYAKTKYPRMILLFIFAGCTGWLQPLDLIFNLLFKQELKQAAGMWLSSEMQEQIATADDPTSVKLNIKLTYLKPHFCAWINQALRERSSEEHQQIIVKRGWDESGMGMAFKFATDETGQFTKNTVEYREAAVLEASGKLFENMTGKKKADLAEKLLTGHFEDIFEAEAEIDSSVKPDGDDVSIEADENEPIFTALRAQGMVHQANMSALQQAQAAGNSNTTDIRSLLQ